MNSPPVFGQVTINSIVRVLLTASFTLTLLQYFISLANANLFPILFLYIAGGLALVSRNRKEMVVQVFSAGGLLILVCTFDVFVSYFNGDQYSLVYGLSLIGIFIAMRLSILQIGFQSIIRCYMLSAIACTILITLQGRNELSKYEPGDSRFTGGTGIHPNLLSFTLASFIPLFLCTSMVLPRGKRRWLNLALGFIALVLMFVTGSRGSFGALLIAFVIAFLRFTLLNPILTRTRFTVPTLLVSLLILGAIVYVTFHGHNIDKLGKFFSTALQLQSKQRGLHSGLSGRTYYWALGISRITGLQWIFGMGFRQSYLVDSGYVTILMENGVFGSTIILGYILVRLVWLWKSTRAYEPAGWWWYRFALWLLILIYLINNVTTRYLFSYGNQFSLLMMFMMMCSRSELVGKTNIAQVSTRGYPEGQFKMELN